jgi:apolipoprotein D and lipocalin family protein
VTNDSKDSFFGAFYPGYNVIALDPDYKYALVAGRTLIACGYFARDGHDEDIKSEYDEMKNSKGIIHAY